MENIILSNSNTQKYADEIANIHFNSYSNRHFTSCFSIEKLKEYYINLIEASDLSILSLSEKKSKVNGFIISGLNTQKGVKKFLKKNKIYLIKTLLKNPKFILKKTRSFVSKKTKKDEPTCAKFRIISIAVSKQNQSQGIGSDMLSFFEKRLIEKKIYQYGLSVNSTNKKATIFYKKMKFELEKETNDAKYFIKNLSGEIN